MLKITVEEHGDENKAIPAGGKYTVYGTIDSIQYDSVFTILSIGLREYDMNLNIDINNLDTMTIKNV